MKMTRRLQIVCEGTGATVFAARWSLSASRSQRAYPAPAAFIDIYGPVIAVAVIILRKELAERRGHPPRDQATPTQAQRPMVGRRASQS